VAKKKRKRTRRPSGTPAATGAGTKPGASSAVQDERAAALSGADDQEEKDGGREDAGQVRTRARSRTSGAAAPPVSNRQARKEAARRERERRLKAARRRARTRRVVRTGLVLGVAGAVGVFAWYRVTADRRLDQAATAAAEQLGCGEVLEPGQGIEDLGRSHSPPFVQGENGEPATSGAHSNPLPAEPHVYDQEIPEANAVHNLEHGYVIVYYQNEGADALPNDVRAALADQVETEDEVLMAPYPKLKEGSSLALAGWTRLQMCDVAEDAAPEDAVTVTRYFIDRFRNTVAPEAGA
jgi:hypothetical protein